MSYLEFLHSLLCVSLAVRLTLKSATTLRLEGLHLHTPTHITPSHHHTPTHITPSHRQTPTHPHLALQTGLLLLQLFGFLTRGLQIQCCHGNLRLRPLGPLPGGLVGSSLSLQFCQQICDSHINPTPTEIFNPFLTRLLSLALSVRCLFMSCLQLCCDIIIPERERERERERE